MKTENTWKKEPLFLKAMDILNVAMALKEYMEPVIESSKKKQMSTLAKVSLQQITNNSLVIPAKIAGAQAGIYDLRMENATLVRMYAREIQAACASLKLMAGSKGNEYLDILHEEIESMRPLFVCWMESFDKSNYLIDSWGLFNPPGVKHDDVDPDHENMFPGFRCFKDDEEPFFEHIYWEELRDMGFELDDMDYEGEEDEDDL